VLAVINSALSAYYYLRIVVCMYIREPLTDEPYAASPALMTALAIAALATVGIGIWPEAFLKFAGFAHSMILASAGG